MFPKFVTIALTALSLPIGGAFAQGTNAAPKKPITIDALMRSGLRAGEPSPVWAPNGSEFVVDNDGVLALYDIPSGKSREIVTLSKLEDAAVQPEHASQFDWKNRRVSDNEVQWFADSKRLLVSADGDLFIVDTATRRFDQLTRTAEMERDPKLSPDNRYVSFGRGPNLYALELETRAVTPLTENGSDTLLNGELDWVYPEELDLATAYWWSPDSRNIAYMQFDIAREPIFPQVSLLNHHALLEPERFPQPGDPNADVRIGIVSVKGGETRWMNFGESRGNLLARVAWLPSSREVAVEKLPRIQNKLDLLVANIETGNSRVLLHEEDPQWINVKDEPYFLSDGRLIWTSERSGFRHLYLYGADGALLNQITSGSWEVDRVLGVDEAHGRVFYMSTEDSPTERQMYVVGLDGTGKRKLTKGAGTHSVSFSACFSPAAAYYLDTYSSLNSPPRSTLYRSDGGEVREYRRPERSEADEYTMLPTEIVKLKASDGTPLYARLIKPQGFEPGRKYPAIVMIYGGPGIQEVHNSWQGLSWDQLLAQKGFVIWQLDNRGSNGRGHKFESVVYHDLGAHELEDQKTGIAYLVSLGFVDPKRIGMYGWSYGGFMTLYTLTHAPGLIAAAISGAPVTDWRNYDSIYTERYMGLPGENENAYNLSSPLTKVVDLEGKLLIIHNIEDDNVHFQNSVQMATALEKANKQFVMLVYPQRSHAVSGELRRSLLEQTTAFFEQNLK